MSLWLCPRTRRGSMPHCWCALCVVFLMIIDSALFSKDGSVDFVCNWAARYVELRAERVSPMWKESR